MLHNKFSLNLLFLATFTLTSCSNLNYKFNSTNIQQHHQADKQNNNEVSLNWFTSSNLKSQDIIPTSEAKLFITNVYQTIDNQIFDPAFKKQQREQHFQEITTQLNAKATWSRGELTQLISNKLKKLSTSHLRILDPVEGEKLFRIIERKPLPDEKPELMVSSKMQGKVGIIRVKSFLIPQVTKAAIDQAKAKLSDAKVIIVDVRGNGGGAGSSISYLIEDIIGADKVIERNRTREGLQIKEPYIFHGYFDDAINAEGIAEIEFSKKHPYVEWRTRLEAKKGPRPHFILVDDKCGSSCDLFAATAQDYGIQILGVRTMGTLFGGDAFRLKWQGFALIVPTLQVVTAKGRTIEGVGVQPDILIPECKINESKCLEKALEFAARAS